MSTNITKFGVRGLIPELTGRSYREVRAFFHSKGYEITNMEEDELDDMPEFKLFSCYETVGQIYPVMSNDGKQWGLEKLLYYEKDGKEAGVSLFSFGTLLDIVQTFSIQYGIRVKSTIVFSYTYYNGCDEPVSFNS